MRFTCTRILRDSTNCLMLFWRVRFESGNKCCKLVFFLSGLLFHSRFVLKNGYVRWPCQRKLQIQKHNLNLHILQRLQGCQMQHIDKQCTNPRNKCTQYNEHSNKKKDKINENAEILSEWVRAINECGFYSSHFYFH